jgi:hypothetical protein
MQELCDTIKRPNLWTVGIDEGEKIESKGIDNLFNTTIAKSFPSFTGGRTSRYKKL